jgi:DNA-binding transcriptional MerR regulator/effector-binding domain-containing protein
MFSIGEFSRITGITVKALRHYHEEGLLAPSWVDEQTGYRYYDDAKIETARLIAFLRSLEFPLTEIRDLLKEGDDDGQSLVQAMERHKRTLNQRIRSFKKSVRSVEQFLAEQRQAGTMNQRAYAVEEKSLEPTLIAGVRLRGRYADCCKGFARIGRAMGRYICGKPMMLHYDEEYREDDADFEACMPVRQPKGDAPPAGIDLRQIPGGRCAALLHKGPYDELGSSYATILKYVKDHGYRILMPTREVYIKGPGMIFKGNPKNYLTEIQILVEAGGR